MDLKSVVRRLFRTPGVVDVGMVGWTSGIQFLGMWVMDELDLSYWFVRSLCRAPGVVVVGVVSRTSCTNFIRTVCGPCLYLVCEGVNET